MSSKKIETLKTYTYSKNTWSEKVNKIWRAPYEIYRTYEDNHFWRLMACRDSVMSLVFWQRAWGHSFKIEKIKWHEAPLVPLVVLQRFCDQNTQIKITRTDLSKLQVKARGEANAKQRRKPWNPFQEDSSFI